MAVVIGRSWIISSDEVHCLRVYESVNASQFTGFDICNSTYLCFYIRDEPIQTHFLTVLVHS